jgi:predicted secreted protein
MKTLINLYYKLTTKDFDQKIESARKTTNMILSSTNGSVSHFYNAQGQKIRGWEGKTYRFKNEMHPLVKKYL